jgi:hypothetical protein
VNKNAIGLLVWDGKIENPKENENLKRMRES